MGDFAALLQDEHAGGQRREAKPLVGLDIRRSSSSRLRKLSSAHQRPVAPTADEAPTSVAVGCNTTPQPAAQLPGEFADNAPPADYRHAPDRDAPSSDGAVQTRASQNDFSNKTNNARAAARGTVSDERDSGSGERAQAEGARGATGEEKSPRAPVAGTSPLPAAGSDRSFTSASEQSFVTSASELAPSLSRGGSWQLPSSVSPVASPARLDPRGPAAAPMAANSFAQGSPEGTSTWAGAAGVEPTDLPKSRPTLGVAQPAAGTQHEEATAAGPASPPMEGSALPEAWGPRPANDDEGAPSDDPPSVRLAAGRCTDGEGLPRPRAWGNGLDFRDIARAGQVSGSGGGAPAMERSAVIDVFSSTPQVLGPDPIGPRDAGQRAPSNPFPPAPEHDVPLPEASSAANTDSAAQAASPLVELTHDSSQPTTFASGEDNDGSAAAAAAPASPAASAAKHGTELSNSAWAEEQASTAGDGRARWEERSQQAASSTSPDRSDQAPSALACGVGTLSSNGTFGCVRAEQGEASEALSIRALGHQDHGALEPQTAPPAMLPSWHELSVSQLADASAGAEWADLPGGSEYGVNLGAVATTASPTADAQVVTAGASAADASFAPLTPASSAASFHTSGSEAPLLAERATVGEGPVSAPPSATSQSSGAARPASPPSIVAWSPSRTPSEGATSETIGPEDAPRAAEEADVAALRAESSAGASGSEAAAARLGASTSSAAVAPQDEHSAAWRAQPKHVLVLTNSGRPVFTLHGECDALAGFMAVIDAVMAFVKDRRDQLHSLRAGRHVIVFLERGPLYLVAASAQGEPEAALRCQLSALHDHLVAILTDSFARVLARNPRFEPRRLLGGTEDVLRAFVASFQSDASVLLGAFAPLRLPPPTRNVAILALQAAAKAGGAQFAFLLAGDLVVALAQPRGHALHAADLLVASSFVRRSASFAAAPESFSPLCLPRFNPRAYLHAYITYLVPAAELCLVLLADRADAFFQLSAAAMALRDRLQEQGVLAAVEAAMRPLGAGCGERGRLTVANLPASAGGGTVGTTPLLHFLYKFPPRGQFVAPSFSPPLDAPALQQAVMPAYARLHASMAPGSFSSGDTAQPLPPGSRQRVHWAQDEQRTLLGYVGAEYELYALFDPLVEKAAAVGICQRLVAWLKAHHAQLFIPL